MLRGVTAGLLVAALSAGAPDAGVALTEVRVPMADFKLVESESGDVDYYRLVEHPEGAYLHAGYQPPYKTALYAYPIPEERRRSVATLRWRWRAVTLPKGGNECEKGKGDSAAVVYLTWRRALRWYTLKYVWSPEAPKGAVCDSKRNPFRAQDTIVVESGGPLGEWRTVELDPDAEFRKHFEDGDPQASVPSFGGIGLMTDGDQTQSPSAADYGGFVVTYRAGP